MKNAITKTFLMVLLAVSGMAKGQSTESDSVLHKLPKQYWIDLVTEQPEGYVVDENGDVHICSAEGLAWLCSVTNGFNGQGYNEFEGKTVFLETDVDMSEAIWIPLYELDYGFRGIFNGNNHIVNGIQLDGNGYDGTTAFISFLFEATISNIVIRNGYYEGNAMGNAFLACMANSSTIDHCFVECEMHGGRCAPFIYSNIDSRITNSMVYCPFLHYDQGNSNSYSGGVFVCTSESYMATPQIINCSAIIKKMDWSENCGFVGEINDGIIENCYAYIGEVLNCPEFPTDPLPRNGITRENWGQIFNCYYNSPLRTRNSEGELIEIPLIDQPCNDLYYVSDAVSFDRDGSGAWKLAKPITFDLESGIVTTDALLDALNFKVDDLNDENLLYWCDTVMDFDNQQLPVFCDLFVTTTNENVSNHSQVLFYPNPTQDKASIKIDSLDEHETYSLELIGIDGRIVIQKTNVGDDVTLDLSDLPSGVYVLNVKGNRVLHRQTLIKTE